MHLQHQLNEKLAQEAQELKEQVKSLTDEKEQLIVSSQQELDYQAESLE